MEENNQQADVQDSEQTDEQEGEVTEEVGVPEQTQDYGYDVDVYVGDFFYVCIVIGAILPAAGMMLANIVRSALVVLGVRHDS